MAEASRRVRILIADDHPIFRHGLRSLLEHEPDLEVVGEAADGVEAVRLVRELRPDLLLLDLALPRQPGLDVLRELGVAASPVRTVVLTAAVDKPQIVEAFRLGARGVVLKESATELLLKCIRAVMAGQCWIARDSVSDLVRELQHASAKPSKGFGLTPRELQVVAAVAAGSTNKDIAGDLGISEDTVKHHMTNIFDKLGVSTRLELALFAANKNLLEAGGVPSTW